MQAQYLRVPIHKLTQKQFHNTLAVQCPNLQHLRLSMMLESSRNKTVRSFHYLSSSLFSMQSIQKFEVSLLALLNDDINWPVDGMVFYKMVKGLSNLEELSIKCPHRIFNGKRFLILSPSLKKSDLTGLCKGAWVFCDCQELERFECNGWVYGSGTRPTDLNSIESFIIDGDLRVSAGQVPFSGLDVPDTYECILYGFHPDDDDSMLKQCRNARFETW